MTNPFAIEAPDRKSPPSESVDPLKGGDIHKWAFDQAALLRAGRFDEVDIANVADEIEDVGRSDYRALESHVEIVLIHMLKGEHQPSRRTRSWSNSIVESRLQIEKLLRQSPSLRRRLDDATAESYADGRSLAAREMDASPSLVSETCPYSVVQIMSTPFKATRP